jgi:hypothetical protein
LLVVWKWVIFVDIGKREEGVVVYFWSLYDFGTVNKVDGGGCMASLDEAYLKQVTGMLLISRHYNMELCLNSNKCL